MRREIEKQVEEFGNNTMLKSNLKCYIIKNRKIQIKVLYNELYFSDKNLDTLFILILKNYLSGKSIMKVCPQGMIAIVHDYDNKLVIGRDPLGLIQVFWTKLNCGIYFDTSLERLIACSGIRKEINEQGIDAFLQLQYIPGELTIWKNIYKIQPGYELTFSNDKVSLKQYWNLRYREIYIDKENICSELERHINDIFTSYDCLKEDNGLIMLSGGDGFKH